MLKTCLLCLSALPIATSAIAGPSGKLPIVLNGNASAVIVTPSAQNPALSLAVSELRHHVQKASGVELPVITEDRVPAEPLVRIYLGATKAAAQAGLDPTKLPRDSYYIKTRGSSIFLVGPDDDGDPLHKSFSTSVGTLFAVYQVLDEDLGVRWIWPGELGEYVPHSRSLYIKTRDVKVLPRFRFCKLRTDRKDELLWMRRMRMHGEAGMKFGHAFGDWGARYGADHPDWFEMGEDGQRHPGASMCVSSPGLHKQIVDNWRAEQQNGVRTTINICENDLNGNCKCPTCLSWDGPEAPKPRPDYYRDVHNVSRRYARFAAEVLKLARERDPNAEVTMYSYLNYVFDPGDIKLDPHIIAGYVADVFFPRTEQDHEWVKRQWMGWHATGASLFYRPNYLLGGYCMPENWVHQYADEWKTFEPNGMIGTDFDSLTGQWASEGLILYAVGRFHAQPKMPVDKVLAEYYSAFGPAAPQIKAYWDYWERYTTEHVDVLKNAHQFWFNYPKEVYKRFTPESFGPAEALLDQAMKAASKDPEALDRVKFLKEGLDHASLCVETSKVIAEKNPSSPEGQLALAKLKVFRQRMKYPYAVNVDYRFFSCLDLERRAGWPE